MSSLCGLKTHFLGSLSTISRGASDLSPVTAQTDLARDLGLDGKDMLWLLELLEEAWGVSLPTSAVVQLALDGPTVGRIWRVLQRALEERLLRQQEGTRHAV
jgi:hypothetical protein